MGAGRHHLISPTCARLTGFGGGFPRMIWRSCLCWVCMCGVFACLTTAFEVFQSGSRFLVLCVPCLYSRFMTSGKLDCNAQRSENITQVACMFFDNGLRTSSLTNCFFCSQSWTWLRQHAYHVPWHAVLNLCSRYINCHVMIGLG